MGGPVDYDRRLHTGYEQGRRLPPATLAHWMAVLSAHAPADRPLTVLDLGCGTGRFAPSLAGAFGGPVWGVEPSARMLEVARTANAHPAVRYLRGVAERIPLRPASCDLALLSLVLHHFADRVAAARELARTVRPGGTVFVRSGFRGRLPDQAWYTWFPRARQIDEAAFPTLDQALAELEAAGFRHRALERVEQPVGSGLASLLERLRYRAYSWFEALTEEEVAAGMTSLERAVAAEGPAPSVIMERTDLLTVYRP